MTEITFVKTRQEPVYILGHSVSDETRHNLSESTKLAWKRRKMNNE